MSSLVLSSGSSCHYLRHREVRSLAWVTQPPINVRDRFCTLSLFSPTQNCKLPLRATGNHRRLSSCGQKLGMRAACRPHPGGLYPDPSAGSGENCPLHQALPRPRRWRRSWNQTTSCVSPSGAGSAWSGQRGLLCRSETCLAPFRSPSAPPPTPQWDDQLRDLAGRLPVAWERGRLLLPVPISPDQTQCPS